MRVRLWTLVYIISCLDIVYGCGKKDGYSNHNTEVLKEWNFTLSSSNENYNTPIPATEATFHMIATSDGSIMYDVKADSSSDRILTAKIFLGDPLTEGTLFLDMPVRVYSTYASGVVADLSASAMATLLNDSIDKYINITSVKAPSGLVRGQLNSAILLSKNIQLRGSSLVPAVNTTTTGMAFIRLISNNVLYSKVVITNNDPADAVTTATINQGVSTANGAAIQTIVSSAAEFGIPKKTTVTSSVYSALINNNTYVLVNSTLKPIGKLRGQLR